MEQELIKFIKEKGEFDGVPIYYLKGGNKFVSYDNKVFDILYMGIYETIEDEPKEVLQFLCIELDENGNDTTNEQFFDYCEIPQENINVILSEVNL